MSQSQSIANYPVQVGYVAAEAAPLESGDRYRPRSKTLPLPFLGPTLLAGVSWVDGGMPALTDTAFAMLTLFCIVYLINEFVKFPRRFGIGGVVLFGGVLIWFCHDYMVNWFGREFAGSSISAKVVAKSAFCHMLFIFSASIGLLLPYGRWLERLLLRVPEPPSSNVYFLLMVGTFLVGMIPYVFFNSEPFYLAIYHQIVSGRNATSSGWLVGRSGNLNYNWGGYIDQLFNIGDLSAIVAGFYALLIARSLWGKLIAWSIWLLQLLLAVGTGTRGKVIAIVVPVIALVYIKNQAIALAMNRRLSTRAYIMTTLLFLAMLATVQFQGEFRNKGYAGADLATVAVFKVAGNHMFSEGLRGYAMVPDDHDFFYNSFPGEMVIRPIPDVIYWFLLHPIPRALWPTKPIDPVYAWYNGVAMGAGIASSEGTTVSQGIVGHFYFRYGLPGVIQGGILFGLLLIISERTLMRTGGRAMGMMVSLGLATWVFRCFRNLTYMELYAFLIGMALMSLLVLCLRPFFSEQG